MLKPPMNDEVTLMVPKLDALGNPIKDGRGRPELEPVVSKARVQYTAQVVENEYGERQDSFLEVDLPPETRVVYETDLKWIDRFLQPVEGSIITVDEKLNYSGTKVYWRKAYVGKKTLR